MLMRSLRALPPVFWSVMIVIVGLPITKSFGWSLHKALGVSPWLVLIGVLIITGVLIYIERRHAKRQAGEDARQND